MKNKPLFPASNSAPCGDDPPTSTVPQPCTTDSHLVVLLLIPGSAAPRDLWTPRRCDVHHLNSSSGRPCSSTSQNPFPHVVIISRHHSNVLRESNLCFLNYRALLPWSPTYIPWVIPPLSYAQGNRTSKYTSPAPHKAASYSPAPTSLFGSLLALRPPFTQIHMFVFALGIKVTFPVLADTHIKPGA